jgi:hypothetical protein
MVFGTFDLVSSPSHSNSRIYPKDVFLKHIEELNRRINREQRKEKIIQIFGDELFEGC